MFRCVAHVLRTSGIESSCTWIQWVDTDSGSILFNTINAFGSHMLLSWFQLNCSVFVLFWFWPKVQCGHCVTVTGTAVPHLQRSIVHGLTVLQAGRLVVTTYFLVKKKRKATFIWRILKMLWISKSFITKIWASETTETTETTTGQDLTFYLFFLPRPAAAVLPSCYSCYLAMAAP